MPGEDKSARNASQNIDRLVQQHARTLYLYALMRVGKQDLAEDIVQDTLLAALQSWQNFAGDSSERTWLFGILLHKILDFFRQNPSRESVDDQSWKKEYFDKTRHWKDKTINWKANPEVLVENVEFWKVLQDCLKELSRLLSITTALHGIHGQTIFGPAYTLSIKTASYATGGMAN